jgi:CBS domain containing-hemolysin-like protein
VTVEDLLEEIVGDIQDEYDVEQPEIVAVNDHCFVCDASMGMHELDNLVGEELPTEDHDSLGGLVLEIAGRIPEVGESFRRRGLTFTVEEMDGPRISRVRVVETIPEGMGEEAPESL